MITQARLKQLLDYNPDSGIFTRKVSVGNCNAGDIISRTDGSGYIVVEIDYIEYKAHRLAVLYMTGKHPENQVDHIKHIRTDNRWCNLREATNQENQRNATLSKNNNSGIVGVNYDRRRNKWQASIGVNYKKVNIGRFKYFLQAVAARFNAEIKYNFHPNHGLNRGES